MNINLQQVKQEKNVGITFLLNFIWSGAGHIYVGGQNNTNNGITAIIVNLVFMILTALTGFFAIFWLPFWIYILVNGFKITKEYNALVLKENEVYLKKENEINEQVKAQEETERKKIRCIDFIENMEKTFKLYKNELLSEEEFNSRKEKLITQINLNKIAEQPEDFLTSIISLKDKKILNQEELKKIKEYIL